MLSVYHKGREPLKSGFIPYRFTIIEICFGNGRKHCGRRRKCWSLAFSPFPTILQKASFLGSLKVGIVW